MKLFCGTCCIDMVLYVPTLYILLKVHLYCLFSGGFYCVGTALAIETNITLPMTSLPVLQAYFSNTSVPSPLQFHLIISAGVNSCLMLKAIHSSSLTQQLCLAIISKVPHLYISYNSQSLRTAKNLCKHHP